MMSTLLLYSIKSAIVLAMLYLPYMLMLRRESFFRFNRMMLLGILLLSLVLPLCNVPGMSLDRQPVVQAAQLQMLELGIPVHVLPEVKVEAEASLGQGASRFSVFLFVSLIYIIGVLVVLSVRLWQVGRLQFGLRRGAIWHQQKDGITVYCHAEDIPSFSWMRSIVISSQDYDEAGREIVMHETGHILGRHSWDVLLLTLVQMVQWWNPLTYALGISLRDVHEYEADDYVLRQGISAQDYQLLLVKKAVGSGSYAFANSFNHSLTKKRITMMKKSKSNPWMRSKALYAIPVAALALSAFATPKFVAPVESAVSKLEYKGTEISPNQQASDEEKQDFSVETSKLVPISEKMRYLVNGHDITMDEAKALDMGKVKSVHVLKGDATKELMGNEVVYIVLDDPKYANSQTGKVNYNQKTGQHIAVKDSQVSTTTPGVTELSNETPEKTVYTDGSDGTFGTHLVGTPEKCYVDGKLVTLEELKALDVNKIESVNVFNDKKEIHVMTKEAKADSIYNVVPVNAQYPGGWDGCFKFLQENMRYPKLCHFFGVQGRVIVQFVVEKDGSLTEIQKVRGPEAKVTQEMVDRFKAENPDSQEQIEVGQALGDLLYEEGLRVLKLMPNWTPAQDKDGNQVRSRFNLPIMFRLN